MGLSEVKQLELSDIVREEAATVLAKQFEEWNIREPTPTEYAEMLDICAHTPYGYDQNEPYQRSNPLPFIITPRSYEVIFRSERNNVCLSSSEPKVYNALSEGQHVTLKLRDAKELTLNYLPPHFDKKVKVEEENVSPVIEQIVDNKQVVYERK